jgi:hypothetical protein
MFEDERLFENKLSTFVSPNRDPTLSDRILLDIHVKPLVYSDIKKRLLISNYTIQSIIIAEDKKVKLDR